MQLPDYITIRSNGAHSTTVNSTLPDSGRSVSVDVYAPEVMFGTERGAQVNWAGIGSVSAADAVRYAEVITFAANLAATL